MVVNRVGMEDSIISTLPFLLSDPVCLLGTESSVECVPPGDGWEEGIADTTKTAEMLLCHRDKVVAGWDSVNSENK